MADAITLLPKSGPGPSTRDMTTPNHLSAGSAELGSIFNIYNQKLKYVGMCSKYLFTSFCIFMQLGVARYG